MVTFQWEFHIYHNKNIWAGTNFNWIASHDMERRPFKIAAIFSISSGNSKRKSRYNRMKIDQSNVFFSRINGINDFFKGFKEVNCSIYSLIELIFFRWYPCLTDTLEKRVSFLLKCGNYPFFDKLKEKYGLNKYSSNAMNGSNGTFWSIFVMEIAFFW